MNKIKVAQIGTSVNSHGNVIFNALKKNSDVFEIVGYALPENEREKFPQNMEMFEGYKELTVDEIVNNPEIDAVVIETEEIYLTKYAQIVANHKKHIHMEKPGGTDFAEFQKLIETVKGNNTVFHVGYMYRYNPYVKELKEQIKNGELGDIISVEAQMNCIHPKEVRQWLSTFKGGMMFFLGCHLVDLIYSIQGEPKNIIPLSKSSGVSGVTAQDFGMAVFEYDNGVSFAKTSAVEKGGFERRQLVVTGTEKTVELKPLEWYEGPDCYTGRYVRNSDDWNIYTPMEKSPLYDRYDNMMRSFAEMVKGEKQNPWSYDYELELYKTVLKACGALNNE
ncbi:MAG: Gfo/Idh/MocA family oxidoreductase [Clostridia bacterium]|nr:Gfo/Idh/MocA family oxidoreductase [Clostridia bacterium]